MQAIETEKVGKHTIEIHIDEEPTDPREWDNLVCFHKRYKLGDEHNINGEDFAGWDEMETHLREKEGAVIVLPLFLYDHSGLRMKVGSFQGHLPAFHAEFDSGQVGFAYITREAILKEYGKRNRLGRRTMERAEKVLRGEVSTYDEFLSGQVYGYVIKDENGEDVDSCWGFFGGIEYCRTEARAAVPKPKKKAKRSKRAK